MIKQGGYLQLNEQEAHCIARLLQSYLYENEDDFLTGCSYCKYKCGSRLSMFYEIRKRLTVETGVDVMGGGHSPLPHGKFPYMTFLKNANEEILEQYQTIFSNLQKTIRHLKGNADIQTNTGSDFCTGNRKSKLSALALDREGELSGS